MSKKPTHTDEQEQKASEATAAYSAHDLLPAADVISEAEYKLVTTADLPMYDEQPPARFFNGGGTHDEIEAWKAAHLITAKAPKVAKAAKESNDV